MLSCYPVEGAHNQLFDMTGDFSIFVTGFKTNAPYFFLQTAIFILRGKKICWVLDFFNINFVDTELSKFKCLCAYIFYISCFLFSFSDSTGSESIWCKLIKLSPNMVL